MELKNKFKLFFWEEKELFLFFIFSSSLNVAIKWNIFNILAISEKEFYIISNKINWTKYKKFWKKNHISMQIELFFWVKLNQDFRNFFKLKNISKENFEKFIDLVCNPPFNCDRNKINKSFEKWDEFYNEAKTWNELENFTKEQKEKLAIIDTISLIYDDIVLNKNQL